MSSQDNMDAKPFDMFTFDWIESDLRHLAILLDVAVSQMQELDHTNPNGSGRHDELDRVGSLFWIARDVAAKLNADMDGAMRDFG